MYQVLTSEENIQGFKQILQHFQKRPGRRNGSEAACKTQGIPSGF
jgi:hypothetical protein